MTLGRLAVRLLILSLAVSSVSCKRGRRSAKPSDPPPDVTSTTTSPHTANGPPRAAPKPRAARAPNLPALPAFSRQAKHPTKQAPPGPKEYGCGAVWDGSEHFPLSCLSDHDESRAAEKTATVLVPYERMKARIAVFPRVVDHRADGTEGAVRDQRPSGTCTTFGTASAIDHAVARWTGKPAHVSTMQVWARYHDTSLLEALEGSVGKTLTVEETWPFDPHEAWTWRRCGPEFPASAKSPCGRSVDEKRLAEADARPAVVVEQVEWLHRDFELIRAKLAAGQDVVFSMEMPPLGHFAPAGEPGSRYIPDFDGAKGGHIMTIAGYAMLPASQGGGAGGDNYYLLHNSWGTRWGDGGYAWIHEATLQKHMRQRFGVVDARATGDGPGGHKHRHRKTGRCAAGQVPDSITGACADRCPDRSPRHDGVCADLADCPHGYVNLTGACVLAAPAEASSDPSTEIRWECGPGGCSYTLPKGVAGSTAEVVSCPAPAFRLAKDHQGLTCVE